MKTIKISKCGECPYFIYPPNWCQHLTYHPVDPSEIHELCPLKKEPIKLELAE